MTDKGFKKGMRVRVVNPGPRRAHTKGWEGYLAQQETKGARVRPTGMWEVIFVSGLATFPPGRIGKGGIGKGEDDETRRRGQPTAGRSITASR